MGQVLSFIFSLKVPTDVRLGTLQYLRGDVEEGHRHIRQQGCQGDAATHGACPGDGDAN
jgi:hypothetical protein